VLDPPRLGLVDQPSGKGQAAGCEVASQAVHTPPSIAWKKRGASYWVSNAPADSHPADALLATAASLQPAS
jgi:hypothetical protein